MATGTRSPRTTSTGPLRSEQSILVHGDDDLAVSTVAVGLALRTSETFAWVDFDDPKGSERAPARSWVEGRSGRPVVDLVDPSLLRPPERDHLAHSGLIAPESTTEAARLQSHLEMPELFQRLAARAICPDGHGVVLLVHVDRLAPALRAGTIEATWLHRTLHDEGLTVIGTSRAPPSEPMRQVFDRVLRVEVAVGRSLEDGSLTEEKCDGRAASGAPMALRTAWEYLDLDPALLSVR
jgi:hypothetical protein